MKICEKDTGLLCSAARGEKGLDHFIIGIPLYFIWFLIVILDVNMTTINSILLYTFVFGLYTVAWFIGLFRVISKA